MDKKKRPIAQAAKAPTSKATILVVPKVEAAKIATSANAATVSAVVKAVKQVSLAVKKEKESAPKKKEPEADAPVLDLKARLMLKMAASAAASSSSSSAAPVPSAAIAVAAPRVHKAAARPKATLDLCSDESEVEGSTLRGMDSLSLDSKPVRKPQPKKVISRSYDDGDSSSEEEKTKKPKAVRKPRAPASAAGSKVQGVKRPKKATGV